MCLGYTKQYTLAEHVQGASETLARDVNGQGQKNSLTAPVLPPTRALFLVRKMANLARTRRRLTRRSHDLVRLWMGSV